MDMRSRRYKGIINYFVSYTSIFSLGPWRNSIRCFIEEGYKIRVFQFADERILMHPTALEENYILIEIHYPKIAKYILFAVKTFFRSFRHLGMNRLSTLGDGIDTLFRNFFFIIACTWKNRCGNNEFFIGGDPGALIAARSIAKKKNGKRIRHCFLLIEIWQRCRGMSREKSTQHLVVQRIHSDRRLSAGSR
jgi:hypothetical protein